MLSIIISENGTTLIFFVEMVKTLGGGVSMQGSVPMHETGSTSFKNFQRFTFLGNAIFIFLNSVIRKNVNIHKYFTIVYQNYFTFPSIYFDKLVFIFQEAYRIG